MRNKYSIVLLLYIYCCVAAKIPEEKSDTSSEIKFNKVVPLSAPESVFFPVLPSEGVVFLAKRTNQERARRCRLFGIAPLQVNDGAALMFVDDLKQTLERYLFGICPQPFKSRWSQIALGNKKNGTTSCDLDLEQNDLAGRLATLSLRAHSAARTDCLRLGAALANTLAELARTAQATNAQAQANAMENKKRKLSKSQKAKIQAKQRTALAVKKKAAAVAAAAAAKLQS